MGRRSGLYQREGLVEVRRGPATAPRGSLGSDKPAAVLADEAGEQLLKGMARRWMPAGPVKAARLSASERSGL
jgi:hypothetical protein